MRSLTPWDVKLEKRSLAQDIAKGLCILFVLQLHGIQLTKEIIYPFYAIVSFSMASFFFFSGYNYRDKGLPLKKLMGQRIGKLLKTYITWTLAVFVIMGAYFLIRKDARIEDILKSFLASILSESGCKMIGWKLPISLFQHVLAPYWFIQYLITSSIIFYVSVGFCLKSLKKLIAVTVILSGISAVFIHFNIYLPWGLHVAPSIAAIMLAGAWFGRYRETFDSSKNYLLTVILSIVSLAVVDLIEIGFPGAGVLGAGLLGEVAGPVEVVFSYLISIFGSYFLVNFGRLIEKVPVISKGLIWLGQHTMIIFLIHRPIAYIIRDAMGLPHFISGDPLYIDHVTLSNLIAFLLMFAVMVPLVILHDRLKGRDLQSLFIRSHT